jgi:hypothetical protein
VDPGLGMLARSPGGCHFEHHPVAVQPEAMTPAQLAAVSYLARYSTRTSCAPYQLRRWSAWCETSRLDPCRDPASHVELFIRHLGDRGLIPSSVNTMMHGVRGFGPSPLVAPSPMHGPSSAIRPCALRV